MDSNCKQLLSEATARSTEPHNCPTSKHFYFYLFSVQSHFIFHQKNLFNWWVPHQTLRASLETSCLLQQQTHKAAENIILRYPCIIIIKLMPISYRKVERVGTGYSCLHVVAKFDHFHPYMSFFPREF